MHIKATDLDNFPTNKTARRMLTSVSPIYDRSYVMKWLYEVMGIELEEMSDYIKQVPLQRFPETATWGIQYLEMKYGLPIDETLSIDERRARVIAARPYRGPVTPYYIEQVVKNISGAEPEVEEHNEEYFFKILLTEILEISKLEQAIAAVDKVKPSHLGVDYEITPEAYEAAGIFFASGVVSVDGRTKVDIKEADSDRIQGGETLMLQVGMCISARMRIPLQKLNTYGELKSRTYGEMRNKTYNQILYEEV